MANISDTQLGYDGAPDGESDYAGLSAPSGEPDFTGLDNIPTRDRILWKKYAAEQSQAAQSDSVSHVMMARDLQDSQNRYQQAIDQIDAKRAELAGQKYPVQGPTTPDAAETIAAGLGGLVSGRPDQANQASIGLAGQRQGREYDAAVHQFGIDRQNSVMDLQDQQALRNFAQQQSAAIQGRMENAQVAQDASNLATYNHLLTLGLSHDQALQQLAAQHGYRVQDLQQSLSNAIAEQNNQAKNQQSLQTILQANRLAEVHEQQKGAALSGLGNTVLNAQSPEEVMAVVASMRRLGYEPPQESIDAWTAGAAERQDRYQSDFGLKQGEAKSLNAYRAKMGEKADQMGDWYDRRPGATGGSSEAQLNNLNRKAAAIDAQITAAQAQLAQPTNRAQRRALQQSIERLKGQKAGLQGQVDYISKQSGNQMVAPGLSGPIGPGQSVTLPDGTVIKRN